MLMARHTSGIALPPAPTPPPVPGIDSIHARLGGNRTPRTSHFRCPYSEHLGHGGVVLRFTAEDTAATAVMV